jgi:hypothetical protein
MSTSEPPRQVLNMVAIDIPCAVPWENMYGDSRVRQCDRCQRQVIDLTELTTAEAIKVLDGAGNPPCVRFSRGPDGRVKTADCAAGVRGWIRRRLRRRAAWAASFFSMLFLPACYTQGMPVRYVKSREVPVCGQAVPVPDEPLSTRDDADESLPEVRNH